MTFWRLLKKPSSFSSRKNVGGEKPHKGRKPDCGLRLTGR
jgi:hypothetical protein